VPLASARLRSPGSAFTNAADSWTSLRCSRWSRSSWRSSARVWRGVGARRVRQGAAATASRGWMRQRRRWGGYIVHVGIAILFLGVAASSAFHSQRDVRIRQGRRRRLALRGQVRAPTATSARTRNRRGTGAPDLRSASVLDVSKDGKHTTRPSSSALRSGQRPERSVIATFLRRRPTSEVDVRWVSSATSGSPVQPASQPEPAIREATRVQRSQVREVTGHTSSRRSAKSYATTAAGELPDDRVPIGRLDWSRRLIAGSGALTALWPAARRAGAPSAPSTRPSSRASSREPEVRASCPAARARRTDASRLDIDAIPP